MEGIDPTDISVFESKLNFVSREMGIVMQRASRSPILNQSHDFSCYVCDGVGNLISQADGVPIHTGGGGFAVERLIEYWRDEIADGDVFLLNDPYVAGGNHLPDFTVIQPVFDHGRILSFVCGRAHQVDIGGGMAGTYNPNAREIYHEGIRIPPVKIVKAGTQCRDVIYLVALNTRFPEMVSADIQAMIGAVGVGSRRINELVEEFGYDMFEPLCGAVLDYAEAVVRKRIEEIPDGSYTGRDLMLNDGFSDTEVTIAVTITVDGSDLHVDFTETGPQIDSYKNSSYTNTCSAVYLAVATLLGGRIPLNGGSYRMIRISAPEGSLVNPKEPAPLTFCTHHPTYEIVHACWRAFEAAVPEMVSAGWGKPCHPVSSGQRPDGSGLFVLFHMSAQPGAGAMSCRDGFDQIGQLQSLGAITMPNLEAYEQIYPVRFLSHQFRIDSAGAGQFRGGSGVEYSVEFLTASRHNLRGEGVGAPTGFGVVKGTAGQAGLVTAGSTREASEDLASYGEASMEAGILTVVSPGGGGWGDPKDRDRQSVLDDLRSGMISHECARDVYGVSE
ncbi:hydantoinase B/oxoprolinase family protein [Hoeflea sp. CAU 1731]